MFTLTFQFSPLLIWETKFIHHPLQHHLSFHFKSYLKYPDNTQTNQWAVERQISMNDFKIIINYYDTTQVKIKDWIWSLIMSILTDSDSPWRWRSQASTRRWWSTWRSRGPATWRPSPWWRSRWRCGPCSTARPAAPAAPPGRCPPQPEIFLEGINIF